MKLWCSGRDLDPGLTRESLSDGGFGKKNVDWIAFQKSLDAKNYRGFYGTELFNYAMKYSECLFKGDLSSIKQLSGPKTVKVLKGLSSLAKFIGCYENFQKLVRNYGLTWVSRSADDLIIDRLSKTQDPDEIWNWIRDVKGFKAGFNEFLDFISVTGLRVSEATNSYNLIVKFTRENTLTEKYYNVKTGFLEHFRFKEIFIRLCSKSGLH